MQSRNLQVVKIIGIVAFLSIGVFPLEFAAFSNAVDEIPTNDGKVLSNEYKFSQSFYNDIFQLYWTVNDSTIYIGMVGHTTGWIAVGFDPTSAMLDADIIFGWVDDEGVTIIYDTYSLNAYGANHPPDIDIGGSNDILTFNGSEESGITTLEFSRYLTTADEYDNNIPKSGTIDIIWAVGNSDDFTSKHIKTGEATLSTIESTATVTTTNNFTDAEISPGFELLVVTSAMLLFGLINRNRRKKG